MKPMLIARLTKEMKISKIVDVLSDKFDLKAYLKGIREKNINNRRNNNKLLAICGINRLCRKNTDI
jgi:hypothetical protein